MTDFIGRITGAAKLNVETYEEVEADTSATGQAMGVVCLSSLAGGVGMMGALGTPNLVDLLLSVIFALLFWVVWAFLNYFIGTRVLPEPQTRADHGELLRTMGFAQAPGLIRVIGIVPGFGIGVSQVGTLVMVGIGIWSLVTMVVAVRQALDYTSTFRAAGVCLVGWLSSFLIYVFLLRLFFF